MSGLFENKKKTFFGRAHIDVLALEREGKILLKEKQFEKAEFVFSRIIDCGDIYWVYLGKALLGRKKYRSAKECFEKVLPQAGSGVEWAYDLFKCLGVCFYYLGDSDCALENLNKAQTLCKNRFDEELQFGYSLIEKYQKKHREAKKRLQLILEKNPSYVEAWVELADIRAQEGDFELAYHNLLRALDLDSNNNQALKTKARWSSQFQETLGLKPLFQFNI